jgi:hypothetical protein
MDARHFLLTNNTPMPYNISVTPLGSCLSKASAGENEIVENSA